MKRCIDHEERQAFQRQAADDFGLNVKERRIQANETLASPSHQ
jgi:hypothetical protein